MRVLPRPRVARSAGAIVGFLVLSCAVARAKVAPMPPLPLTEVTEDGVIVVGRVGRVEAKPTSPGARDTWSVAGYRMTLAVKRQLFGKLRLQGKRVSCELTRKLGRGTECIPEPKQGQHYVVTLLRTKDGSLLIPSDRGLRLGPWLANILPISGPDSPKVAAVEFFVELEQTGGEKQRRRRLLSALFGANPELQLYALQTLQPQALSDEERREFYSRIRDDFLAGPTTAPKVLVQADLIYAEHSTEYAVADQRYERMLEVVRSLRVDSRVKGQALGSLVWMPDRRSELVKALTQQLSEHPEYTVLNGLLCVLFRNREGEMDDLSRAILALSLQCLEHKESWVRFNAASFLERASTAAVVQDLGKEPKEVRARLENAFAKEGDQHARQELARALRRYEGARGHRPDLERGEEQGRNTEPAPGTGTDSSQTKDTREASGRSASEPSPVSSPSSEDTTNARE